MKKIKKIILFFSFSLASSVFCADMIRKGELMHREFDELNLIAERLNNHQSIEDLIDRPTDITPPQPEGPFYPIHMPSDVDYDLTKLGDSPAAKGTVVFIQGQLTNQDGQALPGLTIEIWQACASGKYDHPRDTNPTELDASFQYYGRFVTDDDGKYMFKTIVPGPYPASDSWWRPPHIHMMISKNSAAERKELLTTQMYFNGDSFILPISNINGQDITGEIINRYNRADLLLSRLSQQEQAAVTVNFSETENPESHQGEKILLGIFNIVLNQSILLPQ